MYKQIIENLMQSGWTLTTLEGNWVCATHGSRKRGLLFGNFNELPHEFKSLLRNQAELRQWDVIVFCPEGIDSSLLKQRRFPNIQLWYFDTQKGNLFPFPPTKDQLIPQWLRLLFSGKSEFLGGKTSEIQTSRPLLTYTFLSINLLVFLLMTLAGGSTNQGVLVTFGAKVNTLIQAGEIWRLITSNFIHIGVIHLIFNLYALWALGPLAEKSFGHLRFFMIYILSGLGGSIASYLFTTALSAGASGAIFGLLGALLYYSYKEPYLWKSGLGMNLLLVILVNFGFGLIQPGIDNFAHLGGLLTGILMSFFFSNQKLLNNN